MHEIQRGTPVIFREDGLKEYAGLTGRVTHFSSSNNDEVWVEFDDPTAHYRDPYAPAQPVGEGTWANLRYLDALPTHDGNLSKYRHVTYEEGFFSGARDDYQDGIYIHGEFEGVHLTHEEALSLLEWLKQQEPTLKQKAQEESDPL